MNSTQLLKQVARNIKYLSLSNLIGHEVKIRSFETIITDMFEGSKNLLPEKYTHISTIHPLVIAKYGILDLEFQVSPTYLTDDYQSGTSLLKELGFIKSTKQHQQAQEITKTSDDPLTNDPFCLTELAEELEKKQVLLKLFLEGGSVIENYNLDQMSPEVYREFFDNLSLPSDYFPRKFLITDACFTNAGFTWFHKHFYL